MHVQCQRKHHLPTQPTWRDAELLGPRHIKFPQHVRRSPHPRQHWRRRPLPISTFTRHRRPRPLGRWGFVDARLCIILSCVRGGGVEGQGVHGQHLPLRGWTCCCILPHGDLELLAVFVVMVG